MLMPNAEAARRQKEYPFRQRKLARIFTSEAEAKVNVVEVSPAIPSGVSHTMPGSITITWHDKNADFAFRTRFYVLFNKQHSDWAIKNSLTDAEYLIYPKHGFVSHQDLRDILDSLEQAGGITKDQKQAALAKFLPQAASPPPSASP